jgi:hypothetical protein
MAQNASFKNSGAVSSTAQVIPFRISAHKKAVSLQIRPSSDLVYKEASAALLRRTGILATPEEIMAYRIDCENDAEDIIDLYCVNVL